MERLKRSLSFRKKKDKVPECSKPHQWQEDERKVREGTCSFQVRYLGCIEVFESRGMQVCEEAVKALKANKTRNVWARMSMRKKKGDQQCKGKYQRAILYVSGDALRVVDEISKGLIVDQTIEKVSFCAPDRNHEKGFAYICRDGTTRRWICHGFLALKESGERLSHAVGCAFAICLERKQKRDKESGVTVEYNNKGTSFTRTGSFRPTTITERIADPQSAIVAEPVPLTSTDTPFAVQRPHATDNMLIRQGSFRVFSKLQESSSPFKRQLSLRMNELPSTLERQRAVSEGYQPNGAVSPIPEASPTKEHQDSISNMCQQLREGLTALSSDEDPFSPPVAGAAQHRAATAFPFHTQQQPQPAPTNRAVPPQPPQTVHHVHAAAVHTQNIPEPIKQTNPWATNGTSQPPHPTHARQSSFSEADLWLHSTANVIASVTPPPGPTLPAAHNTPPVAPRNIPASNQGAMGDPFASPSTQPFPVQTNRAPALQHTRAHSIDASEFFALPKKAPTLRELSQRKEIIHFQSQQNGSSATTTGTATNVAWSSQPQQPAHDPFDEAWAAKPSKKKPQPSNNPFSADNSVKAFEVQL